MSRVETTILFLYAIAGLESLVRRGRATRRRLEPRRVAAAEGDSPGGGGALGRGTFSKWLRPILPSYRFFDSIGTRIELRLVPGGATGSPELTLDDRPRRPVWSLFENGRENLWLHQDALVASLVDERDSALPSARDPRVRAVLARAEAFLARRRAPSGPYFVDAYADEVFLLRVAALDWSGVVSG